MQKAQKRLIIALLLSGGAMIMWGVWIPAKAVMAQLLMERAFTQAIATGQPQPPWPWMEAAPIAQLQMPSGARHIVVDQDHGQALAFAPGLVSGSDHPGMVAAHGGSHVIIAAHRDTQFAGLGQIAAGDQLALTLPDGEQVRYQVDGRLISHKDQAQFVRDGTDRISLVTCWPLDGLVPNRPDRLIISASRRMPN